MIPPTPSTGTCGKLGLRAGKGWAGTHMCTLVVLPHHTCEGLRPRETRRLSQGHAAKPFQLTSPGTSAVLEGVLGVQCQGETHPPPPIESESGEEGKDLAEDNRRGGKSPYSREGSGGRWWEAWRERVERRGPEARSRLLFVDSLLSTSQAGRD